MEEIMYRPEDVGKKVINSRGKLSIIRKYHLNDKDMLRIRNRWEEEVKEEDTSLKELAGDYFFNPYRSGIYHYQIKALYLLGCNEWHGLNLVIDKMREVMSKVPVDDPTATNAWEQFKSKSSREFAVICKDYMGRIQENMLMFQRLSRLHPIGYKLKQVYSAVDIRRVSRIGFPQGCFSYRLHTYNNFDDALPIRDYSAYNFPRHNKKYITSKFIGTIVVKEERESNEMSSMQAG